MVTKSKEVAAAVAVILPDILLALPQNGHPAPAPAASAPLQVGSQHTPPREPAMLRMGTP